MRLLGERPVLNPWNHHSLLEARPLLLSWKWKNDLSPRNWSSISSDAPGRTPNTSCNAVTSPRRGRSVAVNNIKTRNNTNTATSGRLCSEHMSYPDSPLDHKHFMPHANTPLLDTHRHVQLTKLTPSCTNMIWVYIWKCCFQVIFEKLSLFSDTADQSTLVHLYFTSALMNSQCSYDLWPV